MSDSNTLFSFDHSELSDNEKFTLVARDPVAPALVGLWIAVRSGSVSKIGHYHSELVALTLDRYVDNPTDPAQIESAKAVLAHMEQINRRSET